MLRKPLGATNHLTSYGSCCCSTGTLRHTRRDSAPASQQGRRSDGGDSSELETHLSLLPPVARAEVSDLKLARIRPPRTANHPNGARFTHTGRTEPLVLVPHDQLMAPFTLTLAAPQKGHDDGAWASSKSSDASRPRRGRVAPDVTLRGHRRPDVTRSISRFEPVSDGRHHAHPESVRARAVAA